MSKGVDLSELRARLASRVRTSLELRDTSRALQAIIDASPLALLTLDRKGIITSWSPSAERMFGWSREETVGRPNPIVPKEKWDEFITLNSRVLLGYGFSGNEVTRWRKDGSPIEVSISTAPLKNATGEVIGAMGVIEDITERKRSVQEREQLLSQLRAVIDNIDMGLILSDSRGRILEMNPAARSLCGYSSLAQARRHPMESRSMFELAFMDGNPVPIEGWPRYRTLRGESFQNWELRIIRKDSDHGWVCSFGGTPILDRNGRVAFSVVTLRDVTERRKAQEDMERKVQERTAELGRFNRTLQAIIDCNQSIIHAVSEQDLLQHFCHISKDIDGVDLVWVGLAENDEAKTVRPAAFVGFRARDFSRLRISWADNEFGRGIAGTAIRTGQICIRPNHPDDPMLTIQREEALNLGFGSSIALPLLSGGHVLGALVLYTAQLGIFDDHQIRMLQELANNLSIGLSALRTRKERDLALQMAEQQAEQLRAMSLELTQTEQRERWRLAQMLHDNLQQQLVGATFSVEVLKGRIRSQSVRQSLDQLSETIGEALNVSRVMTMELSPPVFYEKGLAAGLEWLCSQMDKKYGLKVTLEAVGDIEPDAEPIRMFLFEAVRELLLNIVKHAKVDKARIRIHHLGKDEIEVAVSDTGAGFDTVRLEAGLSTAEGFGLFSLRERLKFLKGRMEIQSEPGHGSRFTIVVPMRISKAD